jgi:hypothetical protein
MIINKTLFDAPKQRFGKFYLEKSLLALCDVVERPF